MLAHFLDFNISRLYVQKFPFIIPAFLAIFLTFSQHYPIIFNNTP